MQLRFSFNITVVFSGSSSIIVRGARPSTPPTMDKQSVLHLELLVDGDAYTQSAVVIVLPAAMFHCWLNDTTVEVIVAPLPALLDPAAVEAPLVAVSVTTSVLSGAVAADQGVATALGLLPCASPFAKSAASNSRALSPFRLQDDMMGVLSGSFLAIAVAFILHGVIVISYWRINTKRKFIECCASIKFPALPIALAMSLHLAISFSGAQLLMGGPTVSDHVVGSIGVLYAVFVPVALVAVCHRVHREYHQYQHQRRGIMRVVQSLIFPLGAILPQSTSHALGAVVSSKLPRAVWLAQAFISPLLMTLAAFFKLECTVGCQWMLSILAAAHIALGAATAVARPRLTHHDNLLGPLALLLNGVLLSVSAAALTTRRVGSAVGLIMMAQTILSEWWRESLLP